MKRWNHRMQTGRDGKSLYALFLATLMLALGIGATTTLFTLLYHVVLRPLDYEDAGRIVVIEGRHEEKGVGRSMISMGDFYDFRQRATAFEEIAAIGRATLVLTSEGEPEEIQTVAASANFFDLFGVQPQLGRTFTSVEETPGQDQVVILSHGIWQRRFGGDLEILGKELTLSGYRYVVIGVMPESFRFGGGRIEFWAPMALDPERLVRKRRGMMTFARLRQGVSIVQAQEEIESLAAQQEATYPQTNMGWTARLVPFHERSVGDVRPALWTLFGATGLILLLAWSNVTHLLITRVAERRKEIAIRRALGASNLSLFWLFLREGMALGIAGGALGLFFAELALRGLVLWPPDRLPRLHGLGIDPRAVLFAAGLAVLSGLLMSVLVAFRGLQSGARVDLSEASLKGSRGRASQRAEGLLVGAQTALALMMLITSGLLIRSFAELSRTDLGFESKRVLILNLYLPFTKYVDDVSRATFFEALLPRLENLPGVESVGTSSVIPLNQPSRPFDHSFVVEGREDLGRSGELRADFRLISPGYFATLGIPLLSGRDVSPRDRMDAPAVALLSRNMVQRYWPEANPIGQRISVHFDSAKAGEPVSFEIVGVVGDVRESGFDSLPKDLIYLPFQQRPSFFASVAIRTTGPPRALLADVKAQIWSIDPEQAMTVATMEENLVEALGDRRFTMLLLVLFAGLALFLTLAGVYGLVSLWTARRTSEIGIRMTFGATAGDILRMTLKRSLMLSLAGIAVGLMLALWGTRLLRGLLYGVSPNDPLTIASAVVFLLIAALAASWWPSRRAAQLDPAKAIRHES